MVKAREKAGGSVMGETPRNSLLLTNSVENYRSLTSMQAKFISANFYSKSKSRVVRGW